MVIIMQSHNSRIKPTDFFGCFSPFNHRELEFDVCRIADCHNSENDSRLDEEEETGTPGGGSSSTTVSPTKTTETIP